ncbi:hypothetical protein J437_LFUL007077 [Ladona fulva]|uniref:Uncharacterized protein n=1 Tax=Ladona fulva TaxID=123851 RepID=A0A8K0JU98_LADFU|nr:hypothetical protein J437_LFUL007077 [Ladona fulva]
MEEYCEKKSRTGGAYTETRESKGMVEGVRYRGRPREEYLAQVRMNAGAASYEEMKRKAQKRDEWRSIFKPI